SDPSFQSFVSGVRRGGQDNAQDRANLAGVISQRRGTSQAEADAQITQWQQQLAQTKQQVGQKAVQAEEKAASGVSRAALVSFAALLLGAIAATFGGGSGAPKFTALEATNVRRGRQPDVHQETAPRSLVKGSSSVRRFSTVWESGKRKMLWTRLPIRQQAKP